MQYTLLGTTGLLVSRLALGTMTFTDGSKTLIALHKVEEKLADELVGRACDSRSKLERQSKLCSRITRMMICAIH